MDTKNIEFSKPLIGSTYAEQGSASLRRREGLVRVLLTQRSLPEIGWDDATIETFRADCAAMDSNNFLESVGAGEREARVYSNLVRRRNMGFGHGIGRSGDVDTVQPKAGGSSLIYKLTNRLALHASKLCGIIKTEKCLVLPLATGMTLALVLLTIKTTMRKDGAKYIIWPRIPIDMNVINKSRIGLIDARPGYNLETASMILSLGDPTMAPPTGTMKFLSVDETQASTRPTRQASFKS